jgi:hypothetical protein
MTSWLLEVLIGAGGGLLIVAVLAQVLAALERAQDARREREAATEKERADGQWDAA